jgi:hypothetical protein
MERVSKLIKPEEVKNFMLAGNASLTFQSSATDNYFTYKIRKHDHKDFWFVSILARPDNTADYTGIGSIYLNRTGDIVYKHSERCSVSPEALSVKVLEWTIRKLDKPEVLAKMNIRHEGYCCRCGRLLTTPTSVENGYGSKCANLISKKMK